MPSFDEITSAQLVQYGPHFFIVDCGEGTQMKLQKYKFPRNQCRAILISHMHGDHVYGLPGLLTSLAISGRKEDLIIIGPYGIKSFIEANLSTTSSYIPYLMDIREYDTESSTVVYSNSQLDIISIPLSHRIPTMGYLFIESPKGLKLRPAIIEKYELSPTQCQLASKGEDIILSDGTVVRNDEVSYKPEQGRKYAYCSDTVYHPPIVPIIRGATLLYHEATYLHSEVALADQWAHATALQAGQIAQAAGIPTLILGHLSARYKDIAPFIDECKDLVLNTIMAAEGLTVEVK
jgi:ribonuclease Z